MHHLTTGENHPVMMKKPVAEEEVVGGVVPHPQVVVGTHLLEQKGVGVEPILEEVGEQYQEKGNTTMDLQDGIENLVKKLMEVDAVDFLPTVVLVFIELVQGKILIFLNGPTRTLLKLLKLVGDSILPVNSVAIWTSRST